MTYIDTLGQQARWQVVRLLNYQQQLKNDLLNQVAKALVAESAILSLKMLRIWQMPRKMVFQRLCKIVCS